MEVNLSHGHKAVILSLSKQNILSKNVYYKDPQVGMLFENIKKKVKVKLLYGHLAVISSLSKLNVESKNFFSKTMNHRWSD